MKARRNVLNKEAMWFTHFAYISDIIGIINLCFFYVLCTFMSRSREGEKFCISKVLLTYQLLCNNEQEP
jgi:hypothetical protein